MFFGKHSRKHVLRLLAYTLAAGLCLCSCQPTTGADSSSSDAPASTDTASTTSPTTTPTTPAYEDDVYGKNYALDKDPFYTKDTIYATWLNVWHGSTETWFLDYAMSNYGTRIPIKDEWVVPDSNKDSHRQYIFNQAKEAGMNLLVMDLTNGHSGWATISKQYQKLCYNNGMKFAAATHPKGSSDVEDVCKYIWETYAQPGKAVFASSYFYKNGKPLMVLYCTPGEFEAASKSSGEYRSKFEFVWASGEDSKADKWGWQLEAQDGPMASKDSMYITPAISWNSPASSVDAWRTSLAFLDFGFLAAKENKPRHIIVGSLDDTSEHNGWMIADTTKKTYEMPLMTSKDLEIGLSYQMKDIYGNISTDAYYNRVKQWTTGQVTPYNAGGLLADGAYTLTNSANKQLFGVERPKARTKPATDIGAAFQRDFNVSTAMETYYWFYHLGNNEYKIIKLSSGLALQAGKDKTLIQDWSQDIPEQRWLVEEQADGRYLIVNKATRETVFDSGSSADPTIRLTSKNAADAKQQWQIAPVPGRTLS